MKFWGAVTEITEQRLKIDLPDGLLGFVDASQVCFCAGDLFLFCLEVSVLVYSYIYLLEVSCTNVHYPVTVLRTLPQKTKSSSQLLL